MSGLITNRIAITSLVTLAFVSGTAIAAPDTELLIPVRHESGGVACTRPTMPNAAAPRESRTLTRLAYFVSDLQATTADGRIVAAANRFQCVDALDGRSALTLGLAKETPVRALAFAVGVPPKENNTDGSEWPAGHALNPMENNLRWDWKRGYVFLAIEGRYVPPTGKPEAFVYHLGDDTNLTTVTVEFDPPVKASELALTFDVDELWKGLSRKEASGVTHSASGDPLAAKLKANVARVFRAGQNAGASQ